MLDFLFDGLQADEALNGLIGLNKVIEKAEKSCCSKMYKLIFMDLQMPVMDGFDSATKILEVLQAKGIETCSIVAVTSNTTREDHERVLRIGMK